MRMVDSSSGRRRTGALPIVGALGVAGVALAAVTLRRQREQQRQHPPDARREALAAYLRDHLSGADAAIQVVGRLALDHEGTAEGALFAGLRDRFREEHAAVTAVLQDLGHSPLSLKRVMSNAAAGVLKAAAGGEPGDLALFRTLEALAVGIQGKRCLWRALQIVMPPLRQPGPRSFADFEADAVDQWESVERFRRSLVARTFAH